MVADFFERQGMTQGVASAFAWSGRSEHFVSLVMEGEDVERVASEAFSSFDSYTGVFRPNLMDGVKMSSK